jgi:hypothetical protein
MTRKLLSTRRLTMSSGSLAPDLRKLREVVVRYWGPFSVK